MVTENRKEEAWRDPIVEEVRRVREEHAARFNYDLDAIAADIKKLEQDVADRLVSLPPHRLPDVSASSSHESV